MLDCSAESLDLAGSFPPTTTYTELHTPTGKSVGTASLTRETAILTRKLSRRRSRCLHLKMEDCLLSDIPVASFQVIVNQLESSDCASLRLVSRSILQRTTQNVPAVIMRLSECSNAEQLQQWSQATRPFQQCTNIHLHIVGSVTAQVFEEAVQLLSQHTQLRELHLMAITSSSNRSLDTPDLLTACVPSLRPLQHIMAGLHTLVIQGIAVQDLSDDLQHLAAAATAAGGGWPLQRLTLNAFWSHNVVFSYTNTRPEPCLQSGFSAAIMDMTAAFPHLKYLTLQMPDIGFTSQVDGAPQLMYAADFLAGGLSATQQSQQKQAATVLAAAMTSVLDAVMQLRSLEVLVVTHVADVWKHRTVDSLSAAASQTADTAASELAATEAGEDRTAAVLATTEAAAATTTTLDECISWLLQQHAKLAEVTLNIADRGLGMFWQQQKQQPSHGFSGSGVAAIRPSPLSSSSAETLAGDVKIFACFDLKWESNESSLVPLNSNSFSITRHTSSSSSPCSLLSRCTRQLCHYSSRPPSTLMRNIISCRLDLYSTMCCVHNLGGWLRELASLKHLEFSVKQVSIGPTETEAAVAVMTAAAGVPGLHSLSVVFLASATVHLPSDLLLPLTAAAGGPGSSLRKLKLVGKFSLASTDDAAWLSMLQSLESLLELSIAQHRGQPLLLLSVDRLPISLQVLEGHRLSLMSSDATLTSCSPLQLRRLQLSDSQFSSPSVLGSPLLQQLAITNCSWSGGWAAAAAAWPNVRELVWRHDSISSSSSIRASGTKNSSATALVEESLRAQTMFRDITLAFASLTSLTVHDVPWLPMTTLNRMVLQPLVQRTGELRNISITVPGLPVYEPDLLQALSEEVQARTGMCCSSSNKDADPDVYQQWLQHHLPWANISVTCS